MVFAIAGSCALLAIYWSPFWIMTAALWFGAVGFVVLGFRALLGRVGQAELGDAPWPAPLDPVSLADPPTVPLERPASAGGYWMPGHPPRPDEPSTTEFTDAVVASGKRIVQGMRTVVLVLSLLVLVPVTLLVAVVSVFQFRDGQVTNGVFALAAAAFTGGFAVEMIRRRKSLLLSIGE